MSPDRSGAHALIQSGGSPSSAQQAAQPINFTEASGCVADAGLMLGQSCRVGWAPNGILVIPGKYLTPRLHLCLVHVSSRQQIKHALALIW